MTHLKECKAAVPATRGVRADSAAADGTLAPEGVDALAAVSAELRDVLARHGCTITDAGVAAIANWHLDAMREMLKPLYLLEKAEQNFLLAKGEQCFRLAEVRRKERAELEAMWLDFSTKAATIETTLRHLRSTGILPERP